jgi:hypothetical protein
VLEIKAQSGAMNIIILDDYQDAVRKLDCAARLDAFPAKVYTNTVKGVGQLSVRLKDAEAVVPARCPGTSTSRPAPNVALRSPRGWALPLHLPS